jgi:hypothetical protein
VRLERIVPISFALTLGTTTALAQTPPDAPKTIAIGDFTLAPTLELRTRAEYRHDPVDMGGLDAAGQPTPRVRDPWLIFERTRLGIGADRGAIGAQVTLQDARAWGTTPTSVLDTPAASFGPYEAYVDAHTGHGPRASFLRIGRQAVQWGEGRLIGISDWSPTGRALDAVRGHVAHGHFDFEILAVLLDAPRPLGQGLGEPTTSQVTSGNELYGVSAAWTLDPLFKIEAFGIGEIARNGGGDSALQTARNSGETYVASLRASGDSRGFKYGAEGAYEFGRAAALNDASRSAYALAAHVGKTFESVALAPTLTIGGSFASGDNTHTGFSNTSTTYKQFDPLLPDVHSHFGAMDIFSWSNVVEGNARISVVPVHSTRVDVEYRYARLATAAGEWLNGYLEPVGQSDGKSGAELGHELDVGFAYRPWVPFELRAGYSVLLLGDGAREIMAAEARGAQQANGSYASQALSHFAYLQATLNVP